MATGSPKRRACLPLSGAGAGAAGVSCDAGAGGGTVPVTCMGWCAFRGTGARDRRGGAHGRARSGAAPNQALCPARPPSGAGKRCAVDGPGPGILHGHLRAVRLPQPAAQDPVHVLRADYLRPLGDRRGQDDRRQQEGPRLGTAETAVGADLLLEGEDLAVRRVVEGVDHDVGGVREGVRAADGVGGAGSEGRERAGLLVEPGERDLRAARPEHEAAVLACRPAGSRRRDGWRGSAAGRGGARRSPPASSGDARPERRPGPGCRRPARSAPSGGRWVCRRGAAARRPPRPAGAGRPVRCCVPRRRCGCAGPGAARAVRSRPAPGRRG